MDKPRVGILIPFYNNPTQYTREIIESVKAQTYKNIRMFLLDDCSTDNGKNWTDICSIFNAIRLPVNVSVFRAYNILGYLAYASECDYVFPAGQDDIMMPTCIEKMVNHAVSGNYDAVNIPVTTFGIEEGVVYQPRITSYEEAFVQNPLTSFTLFKMSVWKEYNGYDVSITPDDVKVGIEDCELTLRMLRDKKRISILDDKEVLYKYRIHEKNSHRIASPHLTRLYKIIQEKHGFEP